MIARLCSVVRAAFHIERRITMSLLAPVLPSLPITILSGVIVLLSASSTTFADEPLREVINRDLSPPTGTTWPVSSDAEFLRRVSLDLNGMPPTADEARAFLNDVDPAKREKLVDRLLESPLYARHLSTTLDVMLMERRPNTHVSQDEWQAWLLKSVRDNKPWNELAREILTADGDMPKPDPAGNATAPSELAAYRAAARFYLDRNSEPNVITRDLGRVFFGRDMQCNQCHDSPVVSDYLQRDYHGLLAIASTGYAVTRKVGEKDVTVFGERSGSDLTFESVFDKGNSHRTAARLPGGLTFVEPSFIPGEEYVVAPADGVRAVPKFSRRAALAEQATNGSSKAFNENIANRLWALMLGRGLVHPLDMMHPDNPAVSPALLAQLGQRFAAMNFDIKALLREIALSDVYQRPFDLTSDPANFVAAKNELQQLESTLPTLQVYARDASSVYSDADTAFSTAESAMLPVAAEVDAARTQYVDALKKLTDGQNAVGDATAAFTAKKNYAEALQAAAVPLQTAVQSLPNEAELAGALKTITDKAAQVTAELPALEQSVAEKTTAVAPLNDALVAVRGTLDATSQKLQPLLEAVRAQEARVIATRSAMQDAQWVASSAKDRLAVFTRVVSAGEQSVATANAKQTVVLAAAACDSANQQVAEYMPVIAERTAALTSAQLIHTSAAASLSSAQEQVSARRNAATALTEAMAALQKAKAALPADEAVILAETALAAKCSTVQESLASSEQAVVAASQMSAVASDSMQQAEASMGDASRELERRQSVAAQAVSVVSETQAAVASAEAGLEKALETVPSDLSSRFALSQLKPLTPEQMCWAIFKVTTVYDRYLAGEVSELDKTAPLTDEQKADSGVLRSRANDLEQRTFDKLKGNVVSYVQIYGGAPGQPQYDFYASPDQALFTANGSAINSWVVPAGDNAAERIVKSTDPRVAAEELYLGTLTRLPTEDEVAEVTAFLAARPDRPRAAQELVWGLVSSAEFRFNK